MESKGTRLLTAPEVAKRLNLSIHTVRRWMSERRLPVVKMGSRVFVTDQAIEELIEKNRIPATPELAL